MSRAKLPKQKSAYKRLDKVAAFGFPPVLHDRTLSAASGLVVQFRRRSRKPYRF
jgi:hypothetical protein